LPADNRRESTTNDSLSPHQLFFSVSAAKSRIAARAAGLHTGDLTLTAETLNILLEDL
jgi:hypothetical protein